MPKSKVLPQMRNVPVVTWMTPTGPVIRVLFYRGVQSEYGLWQCPFCDNEAAIPLHPAPYRTGGIYDIPYKSLPPHPKHHKMLVVTSLSYILVADGQQPVIRPIRDLALVEPRDYVCPKCTEGQYA